MRIGEHMQPLIKGRDKRVGVHSNYNLIVSVFFNDYRHDLYKLFDINLIFSLLGIEMA
jgi:hypothetical protein